MKEPQLPRNLICFGCGAETRGMPASGPDREALMSPPPKQWTIGDRIACCSRDACIKMMDDVWDGKAENFYSPVDQWVWENSKPNDPGDPVIWLAVEVEETPTQHANRVLMHLLPGEHIESGKILFVIRAYSTIDAMTQYHKKMGWEPYRPHPAWDQKNKVWKHPS